MSATAIREVWWIQRRNSCQEVNTTRVTDLFNLIIISRDTVMPFQMHKTCQIGRGYHSVHPPTRKILRRRGYSPNSGYRAKDEEVYDPLTQPDSTLGWDLALAAKKT